jgi:UDP-N-acetylmuramate--alanine ligase
MDPNEPGINDIKLAGHYNRLDAWLAVKAARQLTGKPLEEILGHINRFPGLQRRMEQIAPGLYSDYAHTPEKIRGGLSAALDTAQGKPVVVLFEPLHNRRQHFMIDDYKDCFKGASQLYWLPSYLAREDPSQRVIPPSEMIAHLSDPSIAQVAQRGPELKAIIRKHLDQGHLVVGMAGGGGDSLDEWLRQEFKN